MYNIIQPPNKISADQQRNLKDLQNEAHNISYGPVLVRKLFSETFGKVPSVKLDNTISNGNFHIGGMQNQAYLVGLSEQALTPSVIVELCVTGETPVPPGSRESALRHWASSLPSNYPTKVVAIEIILSGERLACTLRLWDRVTRSFDITRKISGIDFETNYGRLCAELMISANRTLEGASALLSHSMGWDAEEIQSLESFVARISRR